MRKPLLSDEMIARLEQQDQREARVSERFGYYPPDLNQERSVYEPTASFEAYEARQELDKDERNYQGYREGETVRIPVQSSIVKSRRIEGMKQEEFGTKVNKILFWVILLVFLFLVAVFYW